MTSEASSATLKAFFREGSTEERGNSDPAACAHGNFAGDSPGDDQGTSEENLEEYHDVPLAEGTVTENAIGDLARRGPGATGPPRRDDAMSPGVTESAAVSYQPIFSTPTPAAATPDGVAAAAMPNVIPNGVHSAAPGSGFIRAGTPATSAPPASSSSAAAAALQPSPPTANSLSPILAAAFSLFPSSSFAEELPSPLSPPDLSPPLSPSAQPQEQREVGLEAPGGVIGENGGRERGAGAETGGGGRVGVVGSGEGGRNAGVEAGAGRGEAGGEILEVEWGSGEAASGQVASGHVFWSAAMAATDPLESVQCPNSDVEQVRAVASSLLPAIAAATIDQLESSMSLFSSPPSPLEAAEAVKGELLTFLDSRTKGLTAAAAAAAVTALNVTSAAGVTEAMTGAWHGHGGGRGERGEEEGSGGAGGRGGAVEGGLEAATHITSGEASSSAVRVQQGGEEKEPCNTVAVTAVQSLLDEFVAQRQSLLTRFSSAFRRAEHTEDKVASLAQELEESELLDKALRINLAQSLIRRVDAAGTAHCTAQFGTVAGLESHRRQCPFDEVPCANTPCWERVSRYRMPIHDKRCPLKMLPCRQGCRLKIARAGMERHCATDCGMKSVSCPYAPMGCSLPLLQKDVARHCRERVEGHLRAACQLVVEMRQEGQVMERRLDMLEKSISLTERLGKVEHEALRKELQASNKKVTSLEQELSRVRAEARGATSLKKELVMLQEQLKKMQPSMRRTGW
ncbi:hypothetical protein CLOM_g15707 [Closterium sp. NIES-68]|nr:hypothetical protein CLOM_g15707 [Closterium sp. NIES-68]GJP77366.1 hypothetical protein CLOP_g7770 [Closterium sp. NIES-67]